MEPHSLNQLAKRLNLTDLENEQEPYILTPEEEKAITDHEIVRAKSHHAWKMAQKGFSEMEILSTQAQVDWNKEIDREETLRVANSNKNYGIWQKEQREKERQEEGRRIQFLQEHYSAKRMFGLMRWTSENTFGKKLIVHEDNKPLIATLCFFLSRDDRFETQLGYSFKKGLLLRGISGLGKTHLVRCLEQNELNPIKVVSMVEISEDVKSDGEYNLAMNNCKILYLDDVGTEEATINHFGTKINWFKNFIEMYYLRNKIFNKLIISTNNNFSEIEEKYGFRVRSRIKDMFNIIDVSGKDMRG